MNSTESISFETGNIPASFRVIAVGAGAADISRKVNSLGYDCVSCIAAEDPDDCIPADDEKMAVIVAFGNSETANRIARNYHDADVLTLGLLQNPDPSCFDSVMTDATPDAIPGIVEALLQPIIAPGYICYDFNDLSMTLRDTGSFTVLTAMGENIEDAVIDIQNRMEGTPLREPSYLSVHLFFNRNSRKPVKMGEFSSLTDLISRLPDSVNVIWSVHFDEALPADMIKLTIVMSAQCG